MRRWFLSYNSRDLPLAQGFEAALRRKDPEGHIFFDAKNLPAGGFWIPELSRQIAEASSFVFLVGKGGVGPWQTLEYYEALDRRAKERDFPLILVLVDGEPAPGLPFLRNFHWIVSDDVASEKTVAQVLEGATGAQARPNELWRHTAPYRGLSAMTEADADFFFGRTDKTVEVLGALAEAPDRLHVLLGNSGVGKSSLAQAGVVAALRRRAWPVAATGDDPWPQALHESRRWCYLKIRPGTEPVRALVQPFLSTWQFEATDSERPKRQAEWVADLSGGSVQLRDLLDATQARYADELNQPEPPAFLLYVDQGEELYVRADARDRSRFSELIANSLGDARLRIFMSLRADFLGDLQRDEPLFAVHRQINIPPLRELELHEVIRRPPDLLSARFETEQLPKQIARRTSEEAAKDVGALPLLSYLLDDMWTQMVARGDGVLRLPGNAIELGAALVDRADAFISSRPSSENELRNIFTLKLATVRENGEPMPRRASRSEFTDQEWRLISELADHPNRLLVTVTTDEGETYAEVAHEAIFRRWNRLRGWIATEREFLSWRASLQADWQRWRSAPDASKNDALLMGLALAQAQSWLEKRPHELPNVLRDFVSCSGKTDLERRDAARQLEIARSKAEGELARLRVETEAREQRDRADAEERARLAAERALLKTRRRARTVAFVAAACVIASMVVAAPQIVDRLSLVPEIRLVLASKGNLRLSSVAVANLETSISNLSTPLVEWISKPSADQAPWTVAQVWLALRDVVPDPANSGAKLRAALSRTASPACSCWVEVPDSALYALPTAWALLALAAYNEPATPDELKGLLQRQTKDGWWAMYFAADRPGNASTSATAFITLALHQQLQKGLVSPELVDDVRRAIGLGTRWLTANASSPARWVAYPHGRGEDLDYLSVSALVIYVLRTVEGNTRSDDAWLSYLPRRVPDLMQSEVAMTIVYRSETSITLDTTRHYQHPWMLATTADAYLHASTIQRARGLLWLEEALKQTISFDDVGKQEWMAAEELFALRHVKSILELAR
jgi:hypothetical protein